MGLMIPKSGNGCNFNKIYKLKLNEKDSDKHLIGAEIIEFLKWLPTRTAMQSHMDLLTRCSTRISWPLIAVAKRL
jgi:hypothetical protein